MPSSARRPSAAPQADRAGGWSKGQSARQQSSPQRHARTRRAGGDPDWDRQRCLVRLRERLAAPRSVPKLIVLPSGWKNQQSGRLHFLP